MSEVVVGNCTDCTQEGYLDPNIECNECYPAVANSTYDFDHVFVSDKYVRSDFFEDAALDEYANHDNELG